jgi:hypothetical protein
MSRQNDSTPEKEASQQKVKKTSDTLVFYGHVANIVLAGFSIFAIVAALITLCYTHRQIVLLDEGNKHARDSSERELDALALANERELRAYVTAVEAKVRNEDGKDFVQVVIKNAGQTPANDLRATCWVRPTYNGVPLPPVPLDTDYGFVDSEIPDTPGAKGKVGDALLPASNRIEAPSAVLVVGERLFLEESISAGDIALMLKDPSVAIECSGTITYRDIYGTLRTSGYHFVQERPFAKIMQVNEIGNWMK